MVDLFLKLKIDPDLVGFDFDFKSLFWLWVINAVFVITKVEDWPRLSGVQFWFQVSMLTSQVLIAVLEISDNGQNPS